MSLVTYLSLSYAQVTYLSLSWLRTYVYASSRLKASGPLPNCPNTLHL